MLSGIYCYIYCDFVYNPSFHNLTKLNPMKKSLLLLVLILVTGFSWAQSRSRDLYSFSVNGNAVATTANFQQEQKRLSTERASKTPSQTSHFILQFKKLPTVEEQKQLKVNGIKLLNYLQGNAYYISVSPRFYSLRASETKNLRALLEIKPEYRVNQDLASGNIPEYAKAGGDLVKVVITYFKDVDEATVAAEISKLKLSNVKMMGKFHLFSAEVSKSTLVKLSSLDWILNIEPIAPPSELDNNHGKSLHRSNVLNSTIPGLGYGLTGKGVKIGLWDADVYNHRDFNGRVVVREFESHNTDHGTHTAGTITSAGLLDPMAKGMAPDAQLFSWNFNVQSNGLSVPLERISSLDNDGIEITSNSYGFNVTTCPQPYSYNATDYAEDMIANEYPYFLYVYSAGNNQSVCSGGYNTTSKNLKNSLMVAAIDQVENMSTFSSFGPSKDGRLIPNISGDGVDVYSTFFDNGYGYMSGTSMATPGVAGTMALVYQRYKETHGGQRPLSSLMRALACNTAYDLGNPGPDYKFGYGAINGSRAVEVMEKNNYLINTVSQGTRFTKDITVPSGAVALKVMLSWTDPENTGATSRILINDLDLNVSNGGATILPWVLNPTSPAAVAVRDFDGLNNLEQVTVANPVAGTYSINVEGFEIPDGAQDFAVVYDIVMPTLKLTYPIGGEYFTPGSEEVIRWNCEGYSDNLTIEYSADGGVNYSIIASNIPSNVRSYLWTVPAGTSKNVKFRISNGSAFSVTKGLVNVMDVPSNVKVASAQCGGDGPFALTWDVVANAKYEVLKLNGQVYEHLADVTTNSYNITNITQNNNNWYCVRAIDLTNGAISQRSLAVTVNPTVSIAALPFSEKFESQEAANFYFTANKGHGNVRFVNNAQKYGIRLEGTSGPTTDWLAGTDAACFTNNPNYVVKASICNLDASSLAGKNFRLKFDYRQKYRTAAGTSYFRVKVNGDYLTNIDGTQIYGATNQVSYKTVYYDLTPYAGLASVTIEFEAVCKTGYTTYINSSGNYDFSNDTYDVGDFVTIDNIEISEPLSDMALTSLTAGTGVTNAETITVKVKNLSGASVSDIPVSYTVNGGTPVNEVIAGPIAAIAEATYAFTQKADLSIGGFYTIAASVNWANDPVATNNTLSATKANNGTDILIGTSSPTTTCSGVLTDPSGRFADYAISQTKTHTIIPGTAGKNTKVTFTEFSTEPNYDFVYIYDGPTTASPLLGKYSGSTLPPSFISSATGGELTIKFTSDASDNDKGFVATLECVDKPNVDMAITAITKPTSLTGIKTAAEQIQFTAKNNGMQVAASYIAHYQIDSNTPVDETFTTGLASAASETIAFTTLADLSSPGNHTLKVWVEIADDAVAANNQQTVTVVSLASLSDAGISAVAAIAPTRANLSTVAATIKNFGTLPISNFDVAYRINGGAEVTQSVAGPIAVGATAAVTFTTKADLTALNTTYNIEVYTKLVGDALADNDKTTAVVVTPNMPATNVVGTFKTGNTIATSSNTTQFSLTNNFTVEFWLKPDQNPRYGTVFSKGISITHHSEYYPQYYGANVLIISAGGQSYFTPANSITNNVWQHIALTSAADGTIKVYINGVEQVLSNSAKATQAANPTTPVRLGSNSTFSQPYYGGMDEVRIWNSCLSQATITSNMMTDYAANTVGLLANYKFKEGVSNYLYDYSANENTAIVANSDVSGVGFGKFWNTPGSLLTNLNITGEKVPTTFDAATSTFTSIMDAADLSSLVANFTPVMSSVVKVGSTVQSSGVTTNDFSAGPLTYTAEGFGFNAGINQSYTVNVTNDLSSACEMTTFSFETADNSSLSSSIVLDANGNNFYKKVTSGMDLTSLKACYTVSPGAKIYINGGVQANPQSTAVDYSKPLMARVVSENGRTFKNYSITVDARSASADLIAFNIPNEQVGTTSIDAVNHTIGVWVKNSTDLSMLTPVFAVSPKATVYVTSITQLSGTTTNNFTGSVVYTVASEDESTNVDWTVTVLNDNVKPVITLVGDAVMNVAHGSVFVNPGATATDNVDGDISASVVAGGSVNTSTIGTYTLTYNVADASGNTAAEVTRTVNVTDQTKPVITLVGEAAMSIAKGSTFVDPGATATDNVDGNLTASIVVTGNVNMATLGVYTLTYTVVDAAGNAADAVTRNVTVTPETGVDDNSDAMALIYAVDRTVYVNIPVLNGDATLSICNILGSNVYQTEKLILGLNRITVDFAPGVYVVALKADDKTYTRKVVVK